MQSVKYTCNLVLVAEEEPAHKTFVSDAFPGEADLLREIDQASLFDSIKSQDLLNSDCQALAYSREQLAEAALGVVQNGFGALDLREIEIRGNVALSVHSTPHLVVLRCLNQIIRQTVEIQSSDRDTIIRRLTTVLTEGVPHRLYKFDIKKFFDSVDVLDLFRRLSNEPRIPRSAILVLENFLYELVSRDIAGLPRGIQLSATLSEYAMKRFDQHVSWLPEVYYYARYVDDIVIVTGAREDKVQFERLVKKTLPNGLQFNSTKTKHINIPVQYKSDGLPIVGDFDYLGYNFSIHETKRVDHRLCRIIDVTMAPTKIRRLKSRICRAVASFTIDGNQRLLERRLQLLTSNYNLRDLSTGRLRNVGLYCNYRRANSSAALLELDSFLRSIFVGRRSSLARRLSVKMPYQDRRSFLRFSFAKSFHNRAFHNFRARQNSRYVGAMRKWTLKRGNIDRSNTPDDVPIIFSNDGFHANLRRTPTSPGLTRILESIVLNSVERYTVPYRYRIRLTNTSSRQISLAHPAAQYRACLFYQNYGHLIPYFCRHEYISMRRPTKIGSAYFYSNRASDRKKYKGAAIDLLLHDQAVRNPGSFFAYARYDRFYKFFSSAEFVELEKTFSVMRLTDISKCFSSIYSHTMAWAIKDVQHGKENISAVSFANEFDALMQFSNYNETNGIPVGAEISRLFAEIILQSVDIGLLRRAGRNGLARGQDFEVRRYVDDYVIFANSVEVLDELQRGLSDSLQVLNLHLNESKTLTMHRPLQTRKSQIIADATVGLNRFRDQISAFDSDAQAAVPGEIRNPQALMRTLVNDMKVACTNAQAGYEDISPYIIGSISTTIENLIGSFKSAKRSKRFRH